MSEQCAWACIPEGRVRPRKTKFFQMRGKIWNDLVGDGHAGREPLQQQVGDQSAYVGSGPVCNPFLFSPSPLPYMHTCTNTYIHRPASWLSVGQPRLLWALRAALVKRSLRSCAWEGRGFGSKSLPLTRVLRIPRYGGYFL